MLSKTSWYASFAQRNDGKLTMRSIWLASRASPLVIVVTSSVIAALFASVGSLAGSFASKHALIAFQKFKEYSSSAFKYS
ncbi:hypothetical protein D3C86_1354170 [compost metagenome]